VGINIILTLLVSVLQLQLTSPLPSPEMMSGEGVVSHSELQIYKLNKYIYPCHPEFISGSYQFGINTTSWV